MLTLSLLPFILAFSPAFGQQVVVDQIHNATDLSGTWTTGSGAVLTGAGFANPVGFNFTYPKTTGRSFSFLDTPQGSFWEQADYRMTGNAIDPHCITGVLTFQHGSFEYLGNGSLLLTPIAQDGRQLVQDPCAAVSSQITQFNATILFLQWRIFPLTSGGVHLNLYEFDGTPVAPMNLAFKPPNMLPTATLTPSKQTTQARRELAARSGAARTVFMAGGAVSALAGLGALLVLL